MELHEYVKHDAVSLAELIRKRELSPEALLDVTIRAIEGTNPQLNAVVETLYDRARGQIAKGLPDGPFRGVPLLLKDMLDVEGTKSTWGSVLARSNVSPHTHVLGTRMEEAGFVFAGRTNMSELGLLPTTEPTLYGPTNNPWKTSHTPGGSSGGAAAAVAARIVPLAHAADGGGSIRIPAGACGLFGMKASRGRLPGDVEDDPDGFILHGCVSRTVRDSAAFLDAIAGARPNDRWHTPNPFVSFSESARHDPARLRVGVLTKTIIGTSAHRDCIDAVNKTRRQLESLGHITEETSVPGDGAAYVEGFRVLWAMCAGYFLGAAREKVNFPGVPAPVLSFIRRKRVFGTVTWLYSAPTGHAPIELFTRELIKMNTGYTPADLWLAWNRMNTYGAAYTSLFDKYDVLLTPVLGEPTWPTGRFKPPLTHDEAAEMLISYVGFTQVANTAGLPAMSVPSHVNAEGLPIGAHFVGPYAQEARLFSLAGQLERNESFEARRPPIVVAT